MFNQWSSTTEKTFFYNDLDTEDFILRPVNLDDDDDDIAMQLRRSTNDCSCSICYFCILAERYNCIAKFRYSHKM